MKFIFNYSEKHALLLPGRIPNYKRSDLQLQPSSDTKQSIWRVYREAAEQDGTVHPVSYSRFTFLWGKLVPFIVKMKPHLICAGNGIRTVPPSFALPINRSLKRQLLLPMQKNTFALSRWKGSSTSPSARNARKVFKPTLKVMTNLLHPFQMPAFPAIPMTSKCTIHSTMHSKCTFPLICYSLGQSFFDTSNVARERIQC